MLQNIKTVKFNAWESHFQHKIAERRQEELNFLRKRQILSVLNISSFYVMPMLVCFVTFAVFVGTGHRLEPSLTYTVVLVFNILKEPLKMLPSIIGLGLELSIAMSRIEEFLRQEEVDPNLIDNLPYDPFNLALVIQNSSFSWKMPGKQQEK